MLMAGCRRQGNVTIQLFNNKPNVRQSSRLQNHNPREVVKRYDPWEIDPTHTLSWNIWLMLEVLQEPDSSNSLLPTDRKASVVLWHIIQALLALHETQDHVFQLCKRTLPSIWASRQSQR